MMIMISMVMISIIAIMVDVPTTNAGTGFDERLKKHPHPRRKRGHTGSEIGFERRPCRGILESLASLRLT